MDEPYPMREPAQAPAEAAEPRQVQDGGHDREREAASPDAGPACVHHAESVASWYCPHCEAAFCEQCVRIYAGREVRLGACKACGGQCESLTEPTPEEQGIRAGAVEDEEAARQRVLMDWKIPLGLLIGSGLLLLLTLGGLGAAALLVWPMTLGVGAGTAIAGFWISGLVTEADFEPLRPTLLKLAAIGVTVHAARMACWAMFDIREPTGGFEALALLGPLSVTFVIAPMTVLFATAMRLFKLDTFDKVVTVIALFLVDAFGMFALASAGAFG